jgi:starch synthase (maltosyl-transferring)
MPAPDIRPPRLQIEDPQPLIDCGRYPAKACVGDSVAVSATIFRDGADHLRAVVRHRGPGETAWSETPMSPLDADRGGDRWGASFIADSQGRWLWEIEAWTDQHATWCDELDRRIAGGQDNFESEFTEGATLLREAATLAKGKARKQLLTAAATLDGDATTAVAQQLCAFDPEIRELCARHADRSGATRMSAHAEIDVERVRARFGSWYELFPRSWGGLAGVAAELPRLAELGFDVLYLPPIHPIGRTRRKGPNNTLIAGPKDPGSPWAIGSADGGHTAINPELGTMKDFDALIAAAQAQRVEIAMDFAIQCSADHPWLQEHPEWFYRRADGTLKFAENPPKRYEDIYNVNFDCDDWRGLWEALRGVVQFWVERGVRIFRVDNPHTKPFAFWQWLIAEIRAEEPDVLFLAEAFTRAAPMQTLAKLGFSQSYTYFTWKNTRAELTEYVTELARPEVQLYFRPNFFLNTPDILSNYLQHGGPAAFRARLVLAATLSPSYGVYSGFEHFENVAASPGSEEYLDSEKYEIKQRALDGPLLGLIAQIHKLRRDHAALQIFNNVGFLDVENDALIGYAKTAESETLLIVVNLDPGHTQEGVLVVPNTLGVPPVFAVSDLLTGERFDWRIGRNFVRLDPDVGPAHVLLVEHPR